jgi:hypothetical protein
MFVVRPFEAKTISWWYSQKKNIDLDPPYQRRSGIWKPREKAYLLDSIINGYDVPKFYIADFSYANTPLNVNKKQYAVIDGKQRFLALFEFLADGFPLATDFVYEKDDTMKVSGLSYSQLKSDFPDICADVENFNINVMSVITDEKQKIDSLFVRLNRGKALTGAEVRSAMRGIVPQEIQRIAQHRFFDDQIGFSVERKQDENVAAKLLLIESNNGLTDTKKVDLDRLVEEYVLIEKSDVNEYSSRVTTVLDRLVGALEEDSFRFTSSGLIPVFYWLARNQSPIPAGFFTWFANLRDSSGDEDIRTFNTIVRSINDKETFETCYKVLVHKLAEYRNLT